MNNVIIYTEAQNTAKANGPRVAPDMVTYQGVHYPLSAYAKRLWLAGFDNAKGN